MCQNYSPIQQLLPKLSTILYTAAPFKTIPSMHHRASCVSNCINTSLSYRDHFGSFQDHFHVSIFTAQWQDSLYSNRLHSTGPLRTSRQPSRSGRVTSPSCVGSIQYPQRQMVCQHHWFPGHRRFQEMATSRYLQRCRKRGRRRKTFSPPLQIP